MPSKSYVIIELVVGVRRSIPWEYARAARLRTVLDDDDRIDARPTRFFALWSGSGLAFRFSSSSSKKLKKVQTVQKSSCFS